MLIGFVSYFFSTLISDNIETGISFIISHGTKTVLFIGLTDIEIRRFARKK